MAGLPRFQSFFLQYAKQPKFDFDQITDREAVIIVQRIRNREARP
jgi:hypothetical protein